MTGERFCSARSQSQPPAERHRVRSAPLACLLPRDKAARCTCRDIRNPACVVHSCVAMAPPALLQG